MCWRENVFCVFKVEFFSVFLRENGFCVFKGYFFSVFLRGVFSVFLSADFFMCLMKNVFCVFKDILFYRGIPVNLAPPPKAPRPTYTNSLGPDPVIRPC